TRYTYDTNNQMLALVDPGHINRFTNEYDQPGRVIRQTAADGGIHQFAYTEDVNGNIVRTDVTDARTFVRRLTFSTGGYFSVGSILTQTSALGRPEEQITTVQMDPSTSLLSSVTDALTRRTTYAYDQRGNVTDITSLAGTAASQSVKFEYEPS